ncbi:glycoside hydrolase 5 family protein [Microbulbifer elongatus]|uniref:glycoside hydrolase 5 family protein n=1 Tax=Microbulbifer elongatus TaxID=86173 RepID=UPI001E4534EB|nr:cellulase family glycosylhydrolase [Microbulbifer elongatus]
MKTINTLALTVAVVIAGCDHRQATEAGTATAPATAFVRVQDGHFELNGRPYHFTGANYWYGAYLAATDPERLTRELDLMAAQGIDNLRVLALSEQSSLSRSVKPAVVNAPGQLNETLLQGLDRLLAEMHARDMKAVLYLTNFWQWSGGMSQYLVWHQNAALDDPDVSGKWDEYIESTTDFYRCAPCQKQYLDTAATLTQRQNTITGTPYRDDPTIMAWQLANEPRSGGATYNATRATDYIRWVQDSAETLDRLAPNQLVSTGSEGLAGTQQQADVYLQAHDTDAIDYLTVHLWIKNWGWFDSSNPESTYPVAVDKATDYLSRHIAFAKQQEKPLVLEEFGVERDGGSFSPEASTEYRDRFLALIYKTIEQSSRTGGPLVGSNIWTFGGYGRSNNPEYQWRPGSDFLGDPPQEPQGLNSVFDTDTSTLAIIRKHSDSLKN